MVSQYLYSHFYDLTLDYGCNSIHHINNTQEFIVNLLKAIRVALAMKEMNQKQLAERLGMYESAMSQLINRPSITTEKLTQIADALDMKVSELVALGEDK